MPSIQPRKSILITGGSSGIGKAVAHGLLDAGYDLHLQFFSSEEGAQEVQKYGVRNNRIVNLIQADFSKETEILNLTNTVKRSSSLIAIVHCAGVNEKTAFEEVSPAEFDRIFSVNIKAPVFITQQLLPVLTKVPGASVLFVGSSYSYIGGNGEGVLYASSKAALLGLVRTLAKTNVIRANLIVPGYIDAPSLYRQRTASHVNKKKELTPLKRLGTATEVASLGVFLLSSDAAFITGQAIHINGGIHFA